MPVNGQCFLVAQLGLIPAIQHNLDWSLILVHCLNPIQPVTVRIPPLSLLKKAPNYGL
jgi:hypothetical protein